MISTIYNNNFKYNNLAKINFKGNGDENSKIIDSLQKEYSMENDKFYSQINNDIDMKKAQEILKMRIKFLPLLMNKLMIDTDMYVDKKIDCDTFSSIFIDDSAPFYKRIEMGTNKESYVENYKPEIFMLNEIIEKCVKFRNELVTKNQLDNTLEKALDKYTKTDRQGMKHFTI